MCIEPCVGPGNCRMGPVRLPDCVERRPEPGFSFIWISFAYVSSLLFRFFVCCLLVAVFLVLLVLVR